MSVTGLYVNLPVADLAASRAFFGALGFAFDERFSNDDAAALVLGGGATVMLLRRPFFQTFVGKPVGDPAAAVLAINAIEVDRREEVAELLERAVAAGGADERRPQDHGFMIGESFRDLDGHQWEVFWMDPSAAPAA